MASAIRIRTNEVRPSLPLPLWEGVGGRGAYARNIRAYAPLPPTPSHKGRGRLFSFSLLLLARTLSHFSG